MKQTELKAKWKMIFVPVTLQGKDGSTLRRSFLLDTGAAKSEISHETARVMGFSARDGIQKLTITTMAGKIEGYQIILPELRVFNKSFKDFNLAVFDIAVTEESDREIDGLIGMDIISELKLMIDGPSKKVKRL